METAGDLGMYSKHVLSGCGISNQPAQSETASETENTASTAEETVRTGTWESAAQTPYGAYPELVTYTLGQMSGTNNSNLPDGNTYEDNAYTRYLRKMLNIQNENIYMESEDRYDEFVNILIKDQTLPDVLVMSDREMLKELVDNDLVEDLREVYQNCTSKRIKEMFESYGSGLLESVKFDGKLMAIPETVTDHGPRLMWLRKDWIEELGLEEPKTLEDAFDIVEAFVQKTGWEQQTERTRSALSVTQIWWEVPVPAIPLILFLINSWVKPAEVDQPEWRDRLWICDRRNKKRLELSA
ncbi:MAG: extracellular solute-binding protein [Blautia sp.]